MNAKRMLADRLERLVWDKKQAIERDKEARVAERQAAYFEALPPSVRKQLDRRDALAKELREVDDLIAGATGTQIINRGDGRWYNYGVKLTPEDVAEFDARRKAVEAMLEEIPFVLLGSKADDLRAAIAGFEAKLSAIANAPQPEPKPAPVKARRRQPRVINNGGL